MKRWCPVLRALFFLILRLRTLRIPHFKESPTGREKRKKWEGGRKPSLGLLLETHPRAVHGFGHACVLLPWPVTSGRSHLTCVSVSPPMSQGLGQQLYALLSETQGRICQCSVWQKRTRDTAVCDFSKCTEVTCNGERTQSQDLRPRDLSGYGEMCRSQHRHPLANHREQRILWGPHSRPAPAGEGEDQPALGGPSSLAICHFIEANCAFQLYTPSSQPSTSPTTQQQSGLGCCLLRTARCGLSA